MTAAKNLSILRVKAMKILPGKERFLELATEGNLIPVYCDLMADLDTPVSVYAKLHAASGAARLWAAARVSGLAISGLGPRFGAQPIREKATNPARTVLFLRAFPRKMAIGDP